MDWTGNLEFHGLRVESSSVEGRHNAKNLLEVGSVDYFCSLDSPDQWISFDFRFRRIDLSDYQVTMPNDREAGGLREWVLEGSVDGKKWTVIDVRSNVEALNHPGASVSLATFPERKARFIRLRQTGKNWKGDHRLAVAWVDFSGYVTYKDGGS
jgi:hypothetical protein